VSDASSSTWPYVARPLWGDSRSSMPNSATAALRESSRGPEGCACQPSSSCRLMGTTLARGSSLKKNEVRVRKMNNGQQYRADCRRPPLFVIDVGARPHPRFHELFCENRRFLGIGRVVDRCVWRRFDDSSAKRRGGRRGNRGKRRRGASGRIERIAAVGRIGWVAGWTGRVWSRWARWEHWHRCELRCVGHGWQRAHRQ
jgi:hypothetical protein